MVLVRKGLRSWPKALIGFELEVQGFELKVKSAVVTMEVNVKTEVVELGVT